MMSGKVNMENELRERAELDGYTLQSLPVPLGLFGLYRLSKGDEFGLISFTQNEKSQHGQHVSLSSCVKKRAKKNANTKIDHYQALAEGKYKVFKRHMECTYGK